MVFIDQFFRLCRNLDNSLERLENEASVSLMKATRRMKLALRASWLRMRPRTVVHPERAFGNCSERASLPFHPTPAVTKTPFLSNLRRHHTPKVAKTSVRAVFGAWPAVTSSHAKRPIRRWVNRARRVGSDSALDSGRPHVDWLITKMRMWRKEITVALAASCGLSAPRWQKLRFDRRY